MCTAGSHHGHSSYPQPSSSPWMRTCTHMHLYTLLMCTHKHTYALIHSTHMHTHTCMPTQALLHSAHVHMHALYTPPTCTHMHLYTLPMCTCTHMHTHAPVYSAHMHMHAPAHSMHVQVHMHPHACICTPAHMHKHTHALLCSAHARTHLHTCLCMCSLYTHDCACTYMCTQSLERSGGHSSSWRVRHTWSMSYSFNPTFLPHTTFCHTFFTHREASIYITPRQVDKERGAGGCLGMPVSEHRCSGEILSI